MISPALTLSVVVAVALLVLTIGALVGYTSRRRRVARLIGDPLLVTRLLGSDLTLTPWGRLLPVAGAAAAIAAAALSVPPAPLPSGGGPVVLVLDASGSMLAGDAVPNRIEVQRELARALVAGLGERPVGVVAFAGRAFSLTPPTTDRAAVEMYLAALDPTIVTHGGSALGAAIRQGVALLGSPASGQPRGSLVLFGDGDDTEGTAEIREAVALARRAGVPVHSVGIGTAMGAPVPALDLATGAVDGYLREADGRLVITTLGEALLRSIATQTGGEYVDGLGARAVVELMETVAVAPALEATPPSDGRGLPAYVWLAALALTLLILEPVAGAERRREG